MDRTEPALDDVDLTKARAKHPKASIAFDGETHAWGALIPGEGTAGSQLDLEGEQVELRDGMELVVYSEELEAHGLARLLDEGGWGVEINWSEITDLP